MIGSPQTLSQETDPLAKVSITFILVKFQKPNPVMDQHITRLLKEFTSFYPGKGQFRLSGKCLILAMAFSSSWLKQCYLLPIKTTRWMAVNTVKRSGINFLYCAACYKDKSSCRRKLLIFEELAFKL